MKMRPGRSSGGYLMSDDASPPPKSPPRTRSRPPRRRYGGRRQERQTTPSMMTLQPSAAAADGSLSSLSSKESMSKQRATHSVAAARNKNDTGRGRTAATRSTRTNKQQNDSSVSPQQNSLPGTPTQPTSNVTSTRRRSRRGSSKEPRLSTARTTTRSKESKDLCMSAQGPSPPFTRSTRSRQEQKQPMEEEKAATASNDGSSTFSTPTKEARLSSPLSNSKVSAQDPGTPKRENKQPVEEKAARDSESSAASTPTTTNKRSTKQWTDDWSEDSSLVMPPPRRVAKGKKSNSTRQLTVAKHSGRSKKQRNVDPRPRGNSSGKRPQQHGRRRTSSEESKRRNKQSKYSPQDSTPQEHKEEMDTASDDDSLSFPAASTTRKRKEPPTIRVNLTPTNRKNEHWKTKSQLKEVAARHGGMAIQYRVMTHSGKPIGPARDRILPGDVVIQSRHACVSGSFGGSTYSLKKWKLPGNFLLKKPAHVTIYKDTRPNFPPLVDETSHPLIILCDDLPKADRAKAKRFLLRATPGMTFQEFCVLDNHGYDLADDEQEDEETSNVIMDDDDEEEQASRPAKKKARRHHVIVESEDEKEEARPPTSNSRSRQKEAQESRRRQQDNRKKRARSDDKSSLGKRHKVGKSLSQKVVVHFQVDDSKFLALIEGVVDERNREYLSDMLKNGHAQDLPTRGRVLELPGEAMPGKWIGELIIRDEDTSRDGLQNLKSVCIRLRHESAQSLGPLCATQNDSSPEVEQRIRGGGPNNHNSVLSVIPSHGRRNSLVKQGIMAAKGHAEPFIGSISIAAFDGFTSSSEATRSARRMSSKLLGSCRKHAHSQSSDLQNLLPIPEAEISVGVSFVCKVALDEAYGILVAQDEGHIVAVDVVFDEALFASDRSSAFSVDQQEEPVPLTEHLLRQRSGESVTADKHMSEEMQDEDKSEVAFDDNHDNHEVAFDDDDIPNRFSSTGTANATKEKSVTFKLSNDESVEEGRSEVPRALPSEKESFTPKNLPSEPVTQKKKSGRLHWVTPAPPKWTSPQPPEMAKASATDGQEGKALRPHVTPTPARGVSGQNGAFLAMLAQVADDASPAIEDEDGVAADACSDVDEFVDAMEYELCDTNLEALVPKATDSVQTGRVLPCTGRIIVVAFLFLSIMLNPVGFLVQKNHYHGPYAATSSLSSSPFQANAPYESQAESTPHSWFKWVF